MRTDKQRKKAREYMKVYLSQPLRRELHNSFSSRWFHVTVKGNPAKLAKHRANVARASLKYKSKNELALYLYQAIINLDKKTLDKA